MKKKIGLGKQITVLMICASFFIFTCCVSVALVNIKNALTKSAENKINEVLEISYTIMDGYNKRVQNGEMTLADAQNLALKDFSNIRYQGKNYLWVMDKDLKYLYHPLRPYGFDGKALKDKKGRFYIKELGENAIAGKTDFIRDFSVKPGDVTKKKYPKIMKGITYQPWGWTTATGIYLDEIDEMTMQTLWELIGVA